jgi:hypothetical protein
MTRRRLRLRLRGVVLAALVTATVAMAWPPGAAAETSSPAWYRAVEVVTALDKTPPDVPLVVLTGGSVTKECMVSEGVWETQVLRGGGPQVLAYNLSSAMRSFYEDAALVQALPNGPGIVFIGVNLGRFTWAYQRGAVSLARNPTLAAKYTVHHFTSADMMTLAEKRASVVRWMTRSYPTFLSRVDASMWQLRRLVRICKRKGLHPVMLEMPRNMAVIGHAYDAPLRRFHRGCWAIARDYGVPYVNFLSDANLRNRDFRDLGHLIETGRPKYQRLLSQKTIRLLRRYGLTPPIYQAAPARTAPAPHNPAA